MVDITEQPDAGWLVKQLRAWPARIEPTKTTNSTYLMGRAADEIERLRDALKPFADCCDQIADDEDDEEWAKFRLLIKDYRAARDAFTGRA
ncbi:MAG: hypothetical protein A2792_09820 [Sphingomonadales bacterium RIFCSPHIGHO2_01_FULL_65_20]|nr:MAG: hypothetical protein A2792_09820 [Sphingomonadales bacterium RIFCSPHIGHO2_01_FULL_65_20]